MFARSYRIYKVPGRIIQPWTLETFTERKGAEPIWVTNGFYDVAAQAATHLQKIVSDVAVDVQYFDAEGKPSEAPSMEVIWANPDSFPAAVDTVIPVVGEAPGVINPSGV
jgi:hypothetical protein